MMLSTLVCDLTAQRDALARAAEMMLAEAKNDIGGEYSSPATRALYAALALARRTSGV